MGKPTGFLEYQRQLPKDRPPKERMKTDRTKQKCNIRRNQTTATGII